MKENTPLLLFKYCKKVIPIASFVLLISSQAYSQNPAEEAPIELPPPVAEDIFESPPLEAPLSSDLPTDNFDSPALSSSKEEEPEPSVISSASSVAQIDPRIPRYQSLRPKWGVEIASSFHALGKSPSLPGLNGSLVRALSIQGEYQPLKWQGLGVFGLGPSAQIYFPTNRSTLSDQLISMWSVGLQGRYQARFFREQPIVPYGGFIAEYWKYAFKSPAAGSVLARGPFLGAMILLNFLDNRSAADFYSLHGVLRSYLVAELRILSAEDKNVQFSGGSAYFGLRFEF